MYSTSEFLLVSWRHNGDTMATQKLNDRFIRSLEPPPQGSRVYWDAHESGFGLRVTSTGKKAFVLEYRTSTSRKKRMTLGPFPALTATAAKILLTKHKAEVAEGGDPLGTKKSLREGVTLGELTHEYTKFELAVKNKKSRGETERMIAKDVLQLEAGRKVVEITKHDVLKWFDLKTSTAPVAANRMVKLVRRIFVWANKRDLFGEGGILDPTTAVELNKENPDARYLSEKEIGAFLKKVDGCSPDMWKLGPSIADALRLTLFTAQRSGEVVAMEWNEVDFGERVWKQPKEKTKNGMPNTVPLNGLATEVLKRRKANREHGESRVFPGLEQKSLARALNRKDKEGVYINRRHLGKWCEKDPFTPHHLRHTAITQLHELGVDRLVISKIVNHKDRTITGHYDHHPRTNEKQQAMARWDSKLRKIMTGETQKVVPISG